MKHEAVLGLLLVVAGCVAHPTPPVSVQVPSHLLACQTPPEIPLPPKKPRTVDAIAAWGNRNEAALTKAIQALGDCDTKRAEAVELVEKRTQ